MTLSLTLADRHTPMLPEASLKYFSFTFIFTTYCDTVHMSDLNVL